MYFCKMLLDSQELTATLNALLGYEVRFCREFMVDFKPLQAFARANVNGVKGKAAKDALVLAILKKPAATAYIAHLKAEMELETGVTPARILEEVRIIAFQDVRDILKTAGTNVVIRDLEDMVNTRHIKKIKVTRIKTPDGEDTTGQIIEIECHDKLKALELLGKQENMFIKRLDVTTNLEKIVPGNVHNLIINYRKPGEPLAE